MKVGRKQRNTVEYFPHFVGDSKTKSILKSKYGLDGYATWFQLLEILCKSKDHYFDCRDEWSYEWILSEIGIDKNTFENIMDFLARFEKIDPELWQNKIIWCQNLVNNLERVYDKRVSEIPRKPEFPARKSSEDAISGAEINKTGAEITQSTVKESKGKESIGGTPPPTPSEIAKKFFTAWEKPELRGKQFEEFSKILGSCLDAFCEHWTEPTKSGTRQLWQTKPTFELSRRIKTWLRNEDKWKANGKFDWGKSFKPTKGGETPDGRKIICEVQGGYWKLEDGTFLAYHGTRWINVDGKGHAL